MSHPTVTPAAAPNLVADTICRTAELGLSIDNAADAGDVTHLYCHPVTVDLSCPGCGQGCGQGCRVRDHVERRLTDLPIAGHPSVLHVRVPRAVCGNDDCNVAIFRASIPQAADDRQSVTRRVTRWILASHGDRRHERESLRPRPGDRLEEDLHPGLVRVPASHRL